jgi:hypothetical protein
MSTQLPSDIGANLTKSAVEIAGTGAENIQKVLLDLQGGDSGGAMNVIDQGAKSLLSQYGYSGDGTVDITKASGAMIIDDLMQKISTQVQVASQLLAGVNNMTKTASRVLTQG